MARLLATVSLVLAVVIFESPAGKADISTEVFGRISPAIAQVRARNCRDGEARSGTGFLYDRGDRLVTALHVVAGCTRIDAFFERAGGRTIIASVDRVLERVDLALLRLERSAGTPLIASGDRPAANDELSVIAFFLGAPTMDNKPLRVTFGNSKLSSMLPAQVRDDLARSQALDIGMEIVRLDGHLLPGASGAPLVDRQGRVVAIGSGGLKSGAASISWGLPGEHLERLVRSSARNTGNAVRSASLYAAPVAKQSGPGGGGGLDKITCGGFTFVKVGKRSFAELARTTDDALGLQQLLGHFAQYGLPNGITDSYRFDIYMPDGRGAVVAVPDWMTVPASAGTCRARDPNGSIEIAFTGARFANAVQMQIVSSQIELGLLQHPNWQADFSFSYPVPQFRPDGLTVRRKTFHAFTRQPGITQLAFETLAAKGDQLFGVAALNHAHNGVGYQQCALNPAFPACAPLRSQLVKLTQTILAAHLSTFPIY